MLLLHEYASGLALFKIKDDSVLEDAQSVQKSIESADTLKNILEFQTSTHFHDINQALKASKRLIEGKISKKLKKMLTSCEDIQQNLLAVSEPKIGSTIHESLNIPCVTNPIIQELIRGVRQHLSLLIPDFDEASLSSMTSGLAHSLCRYKLKFNPDRIDTMIIQGINLLDEIDKELNTYIMRVREWYGWHFPELGNIVSDNLNYIKLVKKIGSKVDIQSIDLSEIIDANVEANIKIAANTSSGTDITQVDVEKITDLCLQVINLSDYRSSLHNYVVDRMRLVAPNMSSLVGEVVGARLIAHVGSLTNLSKQPSSTIQVLGAEKALFNALKAHKNTPKYGLIYHAPFVSQAPLKFKGRLSRSLAAKTALACRYDALSEKNSLSSHTLNNFKMIECKTAFMNSTSTNNISSFKKQSLQRDKFVKITESHSFSTLNDTAIAKKRKIVDITNDESVDTANQDTNEHIKKKKH